jgi:hypothetical protein
MKRVKAFSASGRWFLDTGKNAMNTDTRTFQLRLSLIDSNPEIWRRVLVPADYTLGELHDVIQIAMGWEDAHLHGFRQKNQTFGPKGDAAFEQDKDEDRVRISDVLLKSGSKIIYEYDFGDSWEHVVELEKVVESRMKTPLPICTEGENACPPEDVGGVWRYNSIVQALGDQNFEDEEGEIDEDLLEWLGEDFSPERFDLHEVNQQFKHWNDYQAGKLDDFDDDSFEDDEPPYNYDASTTPDESEWRELDELDKILAVDIYHREERPHPLAQAAHHHAVIHVAVEEQILTGDPPQIGEALKRLMDEGLSRHEAIHAIGSILYEIVSGLINDEQEPDMKAYAREVANLTRATWEAKNQPDFTKKKPQPRKKKAKKKKSKNKASRRR